MALRTRMRSCLVALSCAIAASSLGCGGGDSNTGGGHAPPGPPTDAHADSASGDAGSEVTGLDAQNEGANDATGEQPIASEAGTQDAADALEDASPDVGEDTLPEAAGDAPTDVSQQDALPDASQQDGPGSETSPDAAPDQTVDADAGGDTLQQDAEPEAGDAGGDADEDGAADVSEDVSADAYDAQPEAEAEASSGCGGGCDEGFVCQFDVCVQSCASDNDCLNDKTCDPFNKLCVAWPYPSYDPACVFIAPPGVFSPKAKCEFSTPPAGDPFPGHKDVQGTPIVIKMDMTGGSTIVAPFTATVVNSYTEGLGILRVLRGGDCTLEANLGGTDLDNDGLVDWINSPAAAAAADLDGDGKPEIVALGGDGSMLAFTRKNQTWSLLWKARTIPNGPVFVDSLFNWTPARSQNWSGPSIYDLDDDAVPELLREGYVFSAAGVMRTALPPNYATYLQGLTPVMANLDQDPAIELTNGRYIWEWNAGQWKQETYFPGATASAPGFVAVADFGAYGAALPADNPELVVIRGGSMMIYAMDGSWAMSPRAIPGGGGGNPTVADYDGDGLPEVGVAGADFYSVFDIDCTSAPRAGGTCDTGNRCDNLAGVPGACPAGVLWSRKTQDHSSNITGSSVFDFEADGKSEVVYADECFTRVYEGTTGAVLFSQYRSSCTWYENPIIADVDGNFRADLVVPSNLACSDGVNGIPCLGLDGNGVDIQFAGLQCKAAADCVSGVCDNGLCRCTATSQCCPAQDNAKCLEDGYKCVAPPAGTPGSGNTCRAAHPHGVQGIRVYSDAQDKWVRSRWVWNQHAYAITHIADMGTVPKTSQWKNNWQQPGLNNFRQNVPGTASPQATSDETVDGTLGFTCGPNGAALSAIVCNRGANDLGAGLVVGFFDGTTKVCQAVTAGSLAPGSCETVSCEWGSPPVSSLTARDVVIVADADSTVTECKEGNNKGTIPDVWCP